jgi:hypothetical protein
MARGDESVNLRNVDSEESPQGWRSGTSQRLVIQNNPSQVSPIPSCRFEWPLFANTEPLDCATDVLGVALPVLP